MLDVHPPHHPVHAWRDFFVHIATIVVGLLIAVGLEQTVELIHRHHQAHEARQSISQELLRDQEILISNIKQLSAQKQQLANDLDLLDSDATDTQVLQGLVFEWNQTRPNKEAWNAAHTNGSIALIPAQDIAAAGYYYDTADNVTEIVLAYFTDVQTASGILEHAPAGRHLTARDRQQLTTISATALGRARACESLDIHSIELLKNANSGER